ncbi:uncharacterized protein PRCAT00004416001 [Priceomyces carsonii]|uniref:uncharacterized protein n=1 Tax=Priceomyces carsonii TaxID=28549 RepID=UPI002EDA4DBD|nr:unnamed protein product [Priceomyces carsonii]
MTVDEKIPIWLDCDPGNDDVFAILLASLHPSFKILGISTVHGNVSLDHTTHNALAVLQMFGFKQDEIKVYRGSNEPLVVPNRFATNVHGRAGIGGIDVLKETILTESTDMSYLKAIREAILDNENKICIACTGPLTNLSKLLSAYPELKSKIRYITIMGGAINLGNITPYSEFNFYGDPQAAHNIVTDEEVCGKVFLAPLNLTHQAVADDKVMNEIYNKDHNTELRKNLNSILAFFGEVYKSRGFSGAPIHDPVAIYALIPLINRNKRNTCFRYLRRKLDVILEGKREGESIIINDTYDKSLEEANGTYVGTEIDIKNFWADVSEAIKNAEKNILRAE